MRTINGREKTAVFVALDKVAGVSVVEVKVGPGNYVLLPPAAAVELAKALTLAAKAIPEGEGVVGTAT